ncbi:MAG: PTS fructose transporter subunit IIA [Pseudomonadota bacterium]
MIGIIVVAHAAIGTEMVKAAKHIMPSAKHIIGVDIDSDKPTEFIREQISDAVKQVDDGDGIIILTDMFGGTPSNICLSCLSDKKIEVISGFNLPMLVKLVCISSDSKLEEVVPFIREYGQKNIIIANQILHSEQKTKNERKPEINT